MIVDWTVPANQNLCAIQDYIEQDNVAASYAVVNRIIDSARTLRDFPDIGRIGRVTGTRPI